MRARCSHRQTSKKVIHFKYWTLSLTCLAVKFCIFQLMQPAIIKCAYSMAAIYSA